MQLLGDLGGINCWPIVRNLKGAVLVKDTVEQGISLLKLMNLLRISPLRAPVIILYRLEVH
jgi:hypothetical protein